MMHSLIRIFAGVVAVMQLGSAAAQNRGLETTRAPVYRERGIVSSVPLEQLEASLKANGALNKEGAWSRYLSQHNGIMVSNGIPDTNPEKYKPVRCKRALVKDANGKYFCDIPILLTKASKNQDGNGWKCEIGIPGVVYGNGYGEDVDENVSYDLRWKIDVVKDALPQDAAAEFVKDGIEIKNNFKDDDDAGMKGNEIKIYFDGNTPALILGKFKARLMTKAYYYEIRLVVREGVNKPLPCDPIDPVVVNTD